MSSEPSIVIGTPTLGGEVSMYYCDGIAQVFEAHAAMARIFRAGEPHQRARNGLVETFKQGPGEILVMIDADIGFDLEDWHLLMEGDEDIVCAGYLRKQPGPPRAVRFGLGFTRIHRRVFDALDLLTREDGAPLLRSAFDGQQSFIDYFPQGIDFEGRWRAEDHAFFALASGAGCSVRVEDRTRLIHHGANLWQWNPAAMKHPCMACGIGEAVCKQMGGCCEKCGHNNI